VSNQLRVTWALVLRPLGMRGEKKKAAKDGK